MSLEERAAEENIYYLRQGRELIAGLDQQIYRRSAGAPFNGGVGSQFRHCIDFYGCFLDGLEEGRVDYSRRQRDRRVEREPAHAVSRLDVLIRRLAEMGSPDLNRTLLIKSDLLLPASALPAWSRSTIHRELQFLVSHTIHHYALIVSLLREQGIALDALSPDFGVAPSTLQHWKKADPLTT